MPTQEPQHFWPDHLFGPKPAVEAEQISEPLPGQHVTPFEMKTGADGNGFHTRDNMLFEPVFYDIPKGDAPDPKAETIDPATTQVSLGE